MKLELSFDQLFLLSNLVEHRQKELNAKLEDYEQYLLQNSSSCDKARLQSEINYMKSDLLVSDSLLLQLGHALWGE